MTFVHRALLLLLSAFCLLSACSYDGDLSAVQCDRDSDCDAPDSECHDGYCLVMDPDPNNNDPDPNNNDPDPNNVEPNQPNNAVEPCPDDQLLCDGDCIDPTESLDHCGDCDNACDGDIPDGASHTCATNPDDPDQSHCSFACNQSLTQCGDHCVDFDSDPEYCGACDRTCSLTEVCSGGECQDTCDEGLTGCYDSCVDLDTDPSFCGDCGIYCDDE